MKSKWTMMRGRDPDDSEPDVAPAEQKFSRFPSHFVPRAWVGPKLVLCWGCCVGCRGEHVVLPAPPSLAPAIELWGSFCCKNASHTFCPFERPIMRLFVKLLANFSGLESADHWANHVRAVVKL